jgi:hypothetical protein
VTVVRLDHCYVGSDVHSKWTDEQYQIFRTISDAPEDRSKMSAYPSFHEMLDFEEDVPKLLALGIRPTLKSIGAVRPFVDRYWNRHGSGHSPGDYVGEVHVHVPSLGLLEMTEVDNIDDACTDELRRRLEDGWRILAIIPQPSQRRPDYILGRSRRSRDE